MSLHSLERGVTGGASGSIGAILKSLSLVTLVTLVTLLGQVRITPEFLSTVVLFSFYVPNVKTDSFLGVPAECFSSQNSW